MVVLKHITANENGRCCCVVVAFFRVCRYKAMQSKAKQVLCIIRSYSVLSAGVYVWYVCVSVCFTQRLSHDRSLYASSCDLILFMSKRYMYTRDDGDDNNDSAKLHHLFIYPYKTVFHILGRYYPIHCFKSVSIASQTVKYYLSSVSMEKHLYKKSTSECIVRLFGTIKNIASIILTDK